MTGGHSISGVILFRDTGHTAASWVGKKNESHLSCRFTRNRIWVREENGLKLATPADTASLFGAAENIVKSPFFNNFIIIFF